MVLFSVFMWQLLNTPWSIRTQTLKFMELHIMLSTREAFLMRLRETALLSSFSDVLIHLTTVKLQQAAHASKLMTLLPTLALCCMSE